MTIVLPTERHAPAAGFDHSKIYIYGSEGVGKTTFCVSADPDHTLLLATEQGYGALDAYVVPVGSWAEFLEVGAQLVAGDHQFTHFAVDTIDELQRMCADHMVKKMGIDHPSDLEYGKGWDAVGTEFKLRIARLCSLGAGVTFVSHAKEIEIDQPVGKVTKMVPTLSGAAQKWLGGFVDFMFYAAVQATEDGEARVLRTEPSARWSAKQRIPQGLPHLPDPLPLDGPAVAKVMTEAFAPKKTRAKKTLERAHEAMKTTVQPGAQTVEERIEELADSDEAQRLLDAAKARLEEVTEGEK